MAGAECAGDLEEQRPWPHRGGRSTAPSSMMTRGPEDQAGFTEAKNVMLHRRRPAAVFSCNTIIHLRMTAR